MNRPTNTRLPIIASALIGIFTVLAPLARADEPSPVPEGPGSTSEQAQRGEELREKLRQQRLGSTFTTTFSVEFPGGTVPEYLNAIRAAFPGANIVGSQGLDEFTVPAISLKDVTIPGALEPLERVAASDNRQAGVKVSLGTGVAAVSTYDGSPIQIGFEETPEPDEPRIITRIWNITWLTAGGGMTLADITGAIETAVSIAADAKPEFRIHEPTGTLVVKGLDTQLDIIDEVIGKLEETAKAARALGEEIASSRFQIEKLRVEITQTQEEIAFYQKRIDSREATGQIYTEDPQTVLSKQGDLREFNMLLAATEARLADLESRVKKPNP